MASDAAELFLGDQQTGADPALALIALMPAFHVEANCLHDGEGRLDHIGAGQSLPELHRKLKAMHGQRFLHPFLQTSRRARIEIHQFAVQSVQRQFGRIIVFQRVGRVQLLCQRPASVPRSNDPARSAVCEPGNAGSAPISGVIFHRCVQRFAAIENVKPRLA